MKRKRLGLIHTSATLVPVFAQLCKAKLPDVDVFNIVDDSLVKGIMEAGTLTTQISHRVTGYIESAEMAGADFVVVTCSSIGAAVEAGAKQVRIPVLRVDQPMADQAVRTGRRIGVIATLRTTLEPTTDLVRRRAVEAGKQTQIISRVIDGAFDALMAGDAQKHDSLVAAALIELSTEVDVVVLAQASMARVVDTLPPADLMVPVLASPGIAMDYVASVLK
jgi:Asp/Glu/hydantoin racemase